MTPASIRSKNPGAMWGKGKGGKINPLAAKWGCRRFEMLNDGKGQGNNIAYFDTFEDGICAQLDLWRTSGNYRNRRFEDAIAIWSGHNNVPAYIAYMQARVPGLTRGTILNDAFWRGSMCVPFLKAQAAHEAGQKYPVSDADWNAAVRRYWNEEGHAQAEDEAKPVEKAWYQRGFIGWLLGVISGGSLGLGSVTVTDTLIYAVCVFIAVVCAALAFWVYVIPPRGSFKVKTPWDG